MSAIVKCPFCEKGIRLLESLRGRKVQCKCGKKFRMPGEKTSDSAVEVQKTVAAKPVRVECSSCAKVYDAMPSMVGRSFSCKKCGFAISVRREETLAAQEAIPVVDDLFDYDPLEAGPPAPSSPTPSSPAPNSPGSSPAQPILAELVDDANLIDTGPPTPAAPVQPMGSAGINHLAPPASTGLPSPGPTSVSNPYWIRQSQERLQNAERIKQRQRAAMTARNRGTNSDMQAKERGENLAGAMINIVIGGVICLIGIGVTAGSYAMASEAGGTYVVAYGAIVFGALQCLKGFFGLFT